MKARPLRWARLGPPGQEATGPVMERADGWRVHVALLLARTPAGVNVRVPHAVQVMARRLEPRRGARSAMKVAELLERDPELLARLVASAGAGGEHG